MTPSDYSNGNSLAHDRMQADVLEALRKTPHRFTRTLNGKEIQLQRHVLIPEMPLVVRSSLRGFVDIIERFQEVDGEEFVWKTGATSYYIVYEIKPKITTVGGLIRQMRAEELLVEQWHNDLAEDSRPCFVRSIPIVHHDDPELPLLRRLWSGLVGVWNAEEKALS